MVATGPSATYRFTSPSHGVQFDVDGDGTPEQTAWIDNVFEVAFLAVDRNGNGKIDDGTELIGGHTVREAGNGIAALARLAPRAEDPWVNGQPTRHQAGSLDSSDAIWPKLLLWHDLNRNGRSEPEELQPVGEVLAEIGMGFSLWRKTDAEGNELAWQGWVRPKRPREDERIRNIYDVIFRTQPVTDGSVKQPR